MCALQSNRPRKEYPCSQQELYTIVEIGWGSYTEYLPSFESYSTLYTATTATDQLAALALARSMPDEDSRDEVHMTLRVQLIALAEDCLKKWMDMSSYIRDGFPENEYENKRQAAGHGYYAAAEGRDWDSVKGLMQNGVDFANANTAELTAGGMSATYITELTNAKTAFEQKYSEFLQSEEQAKMDTDAKIEANNRLYDVLINMFEDGKRIFRDNAAVREQFTFDRIWELVRGGGGGNGSIPADVIELGVYIFDGDSMAAIEGATFRVVNPPSGVPIEGISNADGTVVLRIPGYTPDTSVAVDFEVTVDGYEGVFDSLELVPGNSYSVEVPMVVIPNP